MKRSLRRWAAGGLVVGALAIVPATAAWACISLAGVTTSSASVQPGGSVTVNGIEFGSNPAVVHLDSLDGPVLATAMPDSNSGNFTQSVTLPADVTTGQHVLVVTEAAATPDGKNNGAGTGTPARAVIDVTAQGGAAAAPSTPVAPTVNLTANSGAGAGTLVLIGLAVAGASLFLAGGISLAASRRRRPEAEGVKTP